MEQSEIVIA